MSSQAVHSVDVSAPGVYPAGGPLRLHAARKSYQIADQSGGATFTADVEISNDGTHWKTVATHTQVDFAAGDNSLLENVGFDADQLRFNVTAVVGTIRLSLFVQDD